MTGVVAATTWQDVRASQRVAEASVEANRLVRDEQERRPQLTLAWDPEKGESIPAESRIRVRLRVHNGSGLRPAQGTRVLLDKCVTPDGTAMVFGSPALRWMGEWADRHFEPVVVFGGAWRVNHLGGTRRREPVASQGRSRVPPEVWHRYDVPSRRRVGRSRCTIWLRSTDALYIWRDSDSQSR